MRASFAPVVVFCVLVGCASAPSEGDESNAVARVPGPGIVDVADLAENLDLRYSEAPGGLIELREHPDNIILVYESRNATVNGELVRMDAPCMRRGSGYILSRRDAALVTRTLAAVRRDRAPATAEPAPVVRRPVFRRTELPMEWRPHAPPRPWSAIVIHHMASGTGSAAAIHRMHRQKGWDGLGYHFVIGNGTLTRDGAVEIGYRWTRQAVGAHCRAERFGDINWWNRRSIGICLIGDFTDGRPSVKQLRSLRYLTQTLMATYGIPASAVVPHGNVKKTACPGDRFPWAEFHASLR